MVTSVAVQSGGVSPFSHRVTPSGATVVKVLPSVD